MNFDQQMLCGLKKNTGCWKNVHFSPNHLRGRRKSSFCLMLITSINTFNNKLKHVKCWELKKELAESRLQCFRWAILGEHYKFINWIFVQQGGGTRQTSVLFCLSPRLVHNKIVGWFCVWGCTAYTEDACRAAAVCLGLELGHPFTQALSTKGCYAFESGSYAGKVFYGTGGTTSEIQEPNLTLPRYRPDGWDQACPDCPTGNLILIFQNVCKLIHTTIV